MFVIYQNYILALIFKTKYLYRNVISVVLWCSLKASYSMCYKLQWYQINLLVERWICTLLHVHHCIWEVRVHHSAFGRSKFSTSSWRWSMKLLISFTRSRFLATSSSLWMRSISPPSHPLARWMMSSSRLSILSMWTSCDALTALVMVSLSTRSWRGKMV